ncbi:MAG: tetratricopeptide repeat protein [Croceibacterium sp.]
MAAAAIGYRIWHQPEAARALAGAPIDPLAELERRAHAEPVAKNWQALGAAYFGLGRFDQAADAYRAATKADPSIAGLWSAFGEALVMASARDPMPPEARQAFAKAIALDAKDPRARYFEAVELDLAGDHQGAIGAWLALLSDTPAGAPWESDLVRTIEQVGKINKIDVGPRLATARSIRLPAAPALPAMPGPDAAQLAAASSIPPGQQQQMAEGMVARLAARLEREPGNLDGWVMLMRSYTTLGRPADARAALRQALVADPGDAARLRSAAATLGLSEQLP